MRDVSQLWNDYQFRVLLEDLFKARKDEAMGPLRLEAIFRYVEGNEPKILMSNPPQRAPKRVETEAEEITQATSRQLRRELVSQEPEAAGADLDGGETPAGFEMEDEEQAPERMSFCYKCKAGRKVKRRGKVWRCMTCDSSNVNSLPTAHDKNLGAYAEGEAVNRSNPIEALDKTAALIEEKVKQGIMVFTIPKTSFVQGIKDHLKARRFPFSDISCVLMPRQVHLDTTSASAISGDAGSSSGGWTVTVTR